MISAKLKNSTSLFSLLLGMFAISDAQAQPDATTTEQVTVSGTRISGTNTPTPVQVQSATELLNFTPASISDALTKNPLLMQGVTPNATKSGANGRGAGAPGYYMNLRNLGTIRTLVLEDGHRVPGTFYDTTVDTAMLPQLLVQRVEVVTGGASAVYGSDAVSGVVNFILDRKFEGFKADFNAGISDYGDRRSLKFGVAGGQDLFGGHLIWNAEYRLADGVPDVATRPNGDRGIALIGAGTTASPYYLLSNVRQSNTSPGGLIVSRSSPGYGLQFTSAGTIAPFDTGRATVTTNFSIGGDGGIAHNAYLVPAIQNGQIFAHYQHNISDTITGWVEARYALNRTYSKGQIFSNTAGSNSLTGTCAPANGVCTGNATIGFTTNGASAQYALAIYSGNPYLTAADQGFLFPTAPTSCRPGSSFVPTASPTACPSFLLNRMNNDLMSRLALNQHTGALQLSGGLRGRLLDRFDWDFYYGHGETRTQLTTYSNVNTQKFFAAADAVRDPVTGNIVCNVSLTTPGAFPGCVPFNVFGQSATVINGSNASQASLKYVADDTYWVAHNGLDDFNANINGTIFEGWAGPIKAALGVEYRLASLNVNTSNPINTFNAQYLRLAPPGTFAVSQASPTGTFPSTNLGEFKEVQSGAHGSENISEANFEADVPLLANLPLIASLSVNAAGRYTEYHLGGVDPTSASGATTRSSFSASTWKIGAEWVVIDDVKVRTSRSRDIRAPTLFDLYQQPVISTGGTIDPLTGISGQANNQTVGTPTLEPEVARNTSAGIVLTPTFLPGFTATFDYFHIVIANQIGIVDGKNTAVYNTCIASNGASPLCNLIVRPGAYNDPSPSNFPTAYRQAPQNIQTVWSEGFDVDINYNTSLDQWTPVPGQLALRLLWSHTSLIKSKFNLPGAVTVDDAGASTPPNSGSPRDQATLSLNYSLDDLNIGVMERYYSPVRWNRDPTVVYATPNIPSYFLTDLTVSHDFGDLTGFLNVQNLFNRRPDAIVASAYTGALGLEYPGVPYQDIIGRYFTIGVRLKM